MKTNGAVHTKRKPLVKKLNLSTKNHKPSREKKNFEGGLFQTPNVFRPEDDETTALGFLLRNRVHRTRKNARPRVVVRPSPPAMESEGPYILEIGPAAEGNARITVLPPEIDEDPRKDETLKDLALCLVLGAGLVGIGVWYYGVVSSKN
jgi:hypothetical protein